ncbi:hypothetical protein GCM10007301_15270 [Azorhizobium oxalatiphilum]|uniref:DNA primase n=1 Tax=Azorhizobium oxalatiphilum TaxID=980631 RepID=A0A917BS01_9HYPH|nr:primase-helicase zinc-binding domain-containing protein [Azorhizobium oxalatiphilum]GGF56553.1 hypothetical protein GCM10007301_15270 [Azorhizobium oxalatiphilum]
MSHDADFEAWLAEARSVTCEEVINRRGIQLSKGVERVGPCPACGGKDRFSINTRKDIWLCRGAGSGRSILLVQHLDGCDFLAACETLTGRPSPRGESGTRLSAGELAAREAERQQKAVAAKRADNEYRERERRLSYELFRSSIRAREAPLLLACLERRGLRLPPACRALRFAPDVPYFHGTAQDDLGRTYKRILFRGPAMLAAITDEHSIFRGLHCTWLDLAQPKGKAVIFDPDTGELLPSKKVRGSKQGNRILLSPANDASAPRRSIAGEGIETVLSVWAGLQAEGLGRPDTEFVSAIDLGNLSGAADGMVQHPSLVTVDTRGRQRPRRVSSPVPRMDSEAMWVPDSVSHLTLLADGDSDPFATRCAMERAQARHAVPGRHVTVAWPPLGFDFNDVLLGRHLAPAPGRVAA